METLPLLPVCRATVGLIGAVLPCFTGADYLRAFSADDYVDHSPLKKIFTEEFLQDANCKTTLHALVPFLAMLYITLGAMVGMNLVVGGDFLAGGAGLLASGGMIGQSAWRQQFSITLKMSPSRKLITKASVGKLSAAQAVAALILAAASATLMTMSK
eukprot:SAG31_NODE_5711_length_2368_cov_2.665491_1_plen_158_part_00